MKTLTVCKAESLREAVTEDALIQISDPIPRFDFQLVTLPAWEQTVREFYEGQATVIVDVLQQHLPGGTLDAVLRELCKRKACLLRVPISS